MLLFAALVAVSLSATLQFAPSSLVVAGSAVPIANQGDVLGVGTVPALANFDGMGTMLDPSNSSQLHLIVNTEVMSSPSVVLRLTLDRQFPYKALESTTLFANGYQRLCSGNLAPVSALSFGSLGTTRRVYLSGEESASSRAFAFFVDQPGTGDFPLVSMGRLQFENVMPCPYPQVKTIVACTDDFSPGFVTFHIADKLAVGTDLDKSGLIGGRVYGLQIASWSEGDPNPAPGTRFSLVEVFGLGSDTSRTETAAELALRGATSFARPEDSEWNPAITSRQQELYFATTGFSGARSRIWRLVFDDIENPTAGGVVHILGSTTAFPYWDNVAVSADGQHVYAVTDAAPPQVIDRFPVGGGASQRIGTDEAGSSGFEFTGIVAAPLLGANVFLCARQGTNAQIFAFQVKQCSGPGVCIRQPPICHPTLGTCQFRNLVSDVYDCPEPAVRCRFAMGLKRDEYPGPTQLVYRRALIPVFDSISGSTIFNTDMIDPTGIAASILTTAPIRLALLRLQISCPAATNLASSVTVNLQSSTGSPSPSGVVVANLGSFNDFAPNSLNIVSLPSNVLLAANTRYWIVLSSTNSALCGWSYTNNIAGLQVSTEFQRPASGTVVANSAGVAFMMAVTGDTDLGLE